MVIWIRRCFLKLNGVSNTVWWRLILFWYILFSHTTLSDIWMDKAFRPSHSKWDQNLDLTLLQWDMEHSILFYIPGTDIGPPTLQTLLTYLLYQAFFEGLGEKRIEMRGRSGKRERKGVSYPSLSPFLLPSFFTLFPINAWYSDYCLWLIKKHWKLTIILGPKGEKRNYIKAITDKVNLCREVFFSSFLCMEVKFPVYVKRQTRIFTKWPSFLCTFRLYCSLFLLINQ